MKFFQHCGLGALALSFLVWGCSNKPQEPAQAATNDSLSKQAVQETAVAAAPVDTVEMVLAFSSSSDNNEVYRKIIVKGDQVTIVQGKEKIPGKISDGTIYEPILVNLQGNKLCKYIHEEDEEGYPMDGCYDFIRSKSTHDLQDVLKGKVDPNAAVTLFFTYKKLKLTCNIKGNKIEYVEDLGGGNLQKDEGVLHKGAMYTFNPTYLRAGDDDKAKVKDRWCYMHAFDTEECCFLIRKKSTHTIEEVLGQ